MLKETKLCLWVGALGLAACGAPAENDFSGSAAAGGHATSGGTSGSSGSKSQGGSSGASAAAGGGGSGTGGSGATGGTTTGGSSTGGTGGSDMGGTGLGGTGGTSGSDTGGTGNGGSAGSALGGSSGDATTGGTDMGGAGMGGAAAGRGGKGGATGSGGSAGAPNCDDLTKAYADALAEAKACNADSGKDQCTKLVPSSLSCGCDQFANPDNNEAVAELTSLRKQAGTHCTTVCPAVLCVAPKQGMCQSDSGDGGDGHCVTGSAILQ